MDNKQQNAPAGAAFQPTIYSRIVVRIINLYIKEVESGATSCEVRLKRNLNAVKALRDAGVLSNDVALLTVPTDGSRY